MEGGNKDIEIYVITQLDDKSIRMESDQFMEDWSELDIEHILNQNLYVFKKPLLLYNRLATHYEPI